MHVQTAAVLDFGAAAWGVLALRQKRLSVVEQDVEHGARSEIDAANQ